jgi:hypothetical protein
MIKKGAGSMDKLSTLHLIVNSDQGNVKFKTRVLFDFSVPLCDRL